MRVTGGKFGGRQLLAPATKRIRPTSDRVRQAIFNILEHRDFGMSFTLQNASVADLFAGTGALGIEALSRGARFSLLVDTDAQSRALARANVEALGLTGATKIWRRDATLLGPLGPGANGPFALAFLDPPYGQNLVAPALEALTTGGWLLGQALTVIETAKGEHFDHPGFRQLDARNYGDTDVLFLAPAE
ncbi:MAG: 16S rRNA (guanine(966)-N(2))-methyltransferase RsmD [Rhizomicrobium sp.]